MHELFKKRRSIRRFTSKRVSDAQLREILLAAMVTPSANSLHPVDFVIVKNGDKLDKLSKCGPHQGFVEKAPVAIVVVADPSKSERFWLIDASIAAAHIYLEVTHQGLATCWANVYQGKLKDGSDRETYVRKVLNIPADKRVVCIMPIGCPAESTPEHSEAEYDETKIHQEEW